MFLSCRPFVVITTFLTGLVGVENVITTKGLQDGNIHILDGTTLENKGKNNKLIQWRCEKILNRKV